MIFKDSNISFIANEIKCYSWQYFKMCEIWVHKEFDFILACEILSHENIV